MALAGCILFERKWRDLTIYLASLSLFLVPWLVWVGQAGKVGGYSPLTQYYVGYQSTLSSSHSFEHWAMIVGQNAKYLANTLDHFLLALIPLLQTGSRVPVALLIFGFGLVLIWRTISRAVALYVLLFLSVVLVLPWHPYRHLIPILPIFLATLALVVLASKGVDVLSILRVLALCNTHCHSFFSGFRLRLYSSPTRSDSHGFQGRSPSLLPGHGEFYNPKVSLEGVHRNHASGFGRTSAHPKKWLLLMTRCISCTQGGRESATGFTTPSLTSTLTFQQPDRRSETPK